MKKLILLSAAGLLCYGADAQEAKQSVVRASGDVNAVSAIQPASVIKAAPVGSGSQITASRHGSNAKVTAAPFYTETFGTGTRTSLPTGWTASAGGHPIHAATWHWTNTAATGLYNIGALNSTTKADGWMIYDSDSIGDLNPSALPLTGSLVSPAINCGSHPSVLVSFEQLFRKYQDSTYLDVSIDGGSTYTTFPIPANNDMLDNTTNAKNPTIVRVNITSVAANQANVKLRFRYVINRNSNVGGTFNWLVDDVNVSEIDNVELGIANSGMFQYNGGNNEYTNYSLYSNYPLQLAGSMLPITYLTNNGLNSVSNVLHTATVYYGATGTTPTTQVYTKQFTYPNIPVNGRDSIVDWGEVRDFTPTQIGAYMAAFSIAPTGDAFGINNVDTARFNITDTLLTTYGSRISGGYYLHRPNTNPAGEVTNQMGARFDIPAGKRDTLTSVAVSFDDGTSVGVNTIAQLYRMTGTRASGLNWTPVASMRNKILTSADISTASTIVYTTYMANTAGGQAPFILDSGTYAVIVKTIGALPGTTVVINAAIPINDQFNVQLYNGQADSSDNINGYSFSPAGIATGLEQVPLVRMHFGNKPPAAPGSVATINGVTIGDAFPNPANSSLSIPVSVTSGASINVSLSNMLGQMLQTQSLGNITAGQSKTAVFNTSALANGIYLYTVEANGQRVTNRVVVAH